MRPRKPACRPSSRLLKTSVLASVFERLADILLDTDTSVRRQWRADQLAGSPYSIEPIELILVYEVHPVRTGNRLSVAGEQAGSDQE